MTDVIWSPRASDDVENILYYIRTTSGRPLTAQRIGEEFVELAERVADSAYPGFRHPFAPPEWQYVRHKRWLIFFQRLRQGVEVMRVVDAARDLPRLFADSPDQP